MQIATMTTTGMLEVGARLPTIRQLARDLGVAGGTVARAYRELEADGIIATRGRHGSFVADMNGKAQRGVSNEGAADAAQAFAVRARQLGVDSKRALELAKEAFDSFGTATDA